MPAQSSLFDQKVARIIARYSGRKAISRITQDFIDEAIIDTSEDANWARYVAESRQIIGRHNKRQRRLGQTEKQLFSFTVRSEEGEQFQRYKRVERMTQDEAEILTEQRLKRVKQEQKVFTDLTGYFAKKYDSFLPRMETLCPEIKQYLLIPDVDDGPDDYESAN